MLTPNMHLNIFLGCKTRSGGFTHTSSETVVGNDATISSPDGL